LAEIVGKYGNVVEFKGRGKSKPTNGCSQTGMMGDIFELGTLELNKDSPVSTTEKFRKFKEELFRLTTTLTLFGQSLTASGYCRAS
jgi:hypothetical protein